MCTKKKNLHMAGMYHHTFALIYVQSIFNAYNLTQDDFCRYVHQCPQVEEKSSNFTRKIHIYLWNNFPRAMEGLESKRKRLNTNDGEGHLTLTRNY